MLLELNARVRAITPKRGILGVQLDGLGVQVCCLVKAMICSVR